jgi:hypothetical protein
MPKRLPEEPNRPSRDFAVRAAKDWHRDGSTALYRFALTRIVWDEQHRADMLQEVGECMAWLANYRRARAACPIGDRGPDKFRREGYRLKRLVEYITAAAARY